MRTDRAMEHMQQLIAEAASDRLARGGTGDRPPRGRVVGSVVARMRADLADLRDRAAGEPSLSDRAGLERPC